MAACITTVNTCGCKGIRSCIVCEQNGLKEPSKRTITAVRSSSWVICTICSRPLPAWEVDFTESGAEFHRRVCVSSDDSSLVSDKKQRKIEGIFVAENFITSQEEISLLDAVDNGERWQISQSGRRKQDFGPKVNFKKRRIRTGEFRGFPDFCRFLVDRLQCQVPELSDFRPVEMCFLEYDPVRGSSIDPHRDDSWLWGERLVTCNLGANCVLTLSQDADGHVFRVPMRRRSILVLSSEARNQWNHGILREDVSARRVAITWRELSQEFLAGGKLEQEGSSLLDIAKNYY